MIKFLVHKFIKNGENIQNAKVREEYSVLGGVLGIICNLFLFFLKAFIGAFMGSIAIISDAFNNLSDSGSSLVSIIGAKLSNRKPDKDHPFGHGRFEYISSLIVSFIIILVGFELFKTAIDKILNPQAVEFGPVMLIILTLSVLVKVWMYSYNKYLGLKINSGVLMAASKDSLNDVIATLAVIITTVISGYIELPQLDGIVGLLVSLLIMKSGFEISRDTIGLLLGKTPDPEVVKNIVSIVSSDENIVGVHDLIVHDYGPGRVMASIHAEVPDNGNIVKIHEIIDFLEKRAENELGIHMVIHMDPISVDCEKTKEIKNTVISIVKGINPEFNIHDFRMTDGEYNINLIFDIEVPADYKERATLIDRIQEKLKTIDKRYTTVINIDTIYH